MIATALEQKVVTESEWLAAHREHLARSLPEHALAELVEFLDPNAGSEFLSGAALIASAFAVSLPGSSQVDSSVRRPDRRTSARLR